MKAALHNLINGSQNRAAFITWLCPDPKASYAGANSTITLPRAISLGLSIGRGCPMLIPLRHENMEGRRWPVVTFALIALNVLIFFGPHWKIEEQEPERIEVRMHVLVLAATHPELNMPDDVEKFVNEVKRRAPEAAWQKLSSRKRKQEDAWDGQIPDLENPQELQAATDYLAPKLTESANKTILQN